MKRIIIILSVCMALTGYTQTKKTAVKKTVAKNESKTASKLTEEPATKLDAATAGKYAKELGRKMYEMVDFEREKGNYGMSIYRWKPLIFTKDDGGKTTWYMIDVTIRWQSSQGGWPVSWNDVEYNGFIVCDEFGCEPNFLIKSKTEPSRAGLAALVVKRSPVGELDDQHKQGLGMMDSWLSSVAYVWSPNGCLGE